MSIVIAGGHGQIALLPGRCLAEAGHRLEGMGRSTERVCDVRARGIEPLIPDGVTVSAEELARQLPGADALVFATGAVPGRAVILRTSRARALWTGVRRCGPRKPAS